MGLLTKGPVSVEGTRIGFSPYGDVLMERHARHVHGIPVGKQIRFAAEALAGGLKQTAAGARLSGKAVVGKVALWLAHQDDPA